MLTGKRKWWWMTNSIANERYPLHLSNAHVTCLAVSQRCHPRSRRCHCTWCLRIVHEPYLKVLQLETLSFLTLSCGPGQAAMSGRFSTVWILYKRKLDGSMLVTHCYSFWHHNSTKLAHDDDIVRPNGHFNKSFLGIFSVIHGFVRSDRTYRPPYCIFILRNAGRSIQFFLPMSCFWRYWIQPQHRC